MKQLFRFFKRVFNVNWNQSAGFFFFLCEILEITYALKCILNNSVDTNIWSRCSFSTCFIFFQKKKSTLWIRCCIIWWLRRPFRWIIGNFSFSRLRACKSASYINVQQKKWCPFWSLPFANFLDPPRDGEPGSFWCYTLIRIRWVSGLPLLGVVTSFWDFSDLWFTVTLLNILEINRPPENSNCPLQLNQICFLSFFWNFQFAVHIFLSVTFRLYPTIISYCKKICWHFQRCPAVKINTFKVTCQGIGHLMDHGTAQKRNIHC